MSQFKGSKSPWSISGDSEKWNRIIDANGDLITTCYAMQNEDDANANLIAAAPELLEALQQSMKIWENHRLDMSEASILIDCRAAIAKALGQ